MDHLTLLDREYNSILKRRITEIISESDTPLSLYQIALKADGASPIHIKSYLHEIGYKYNSSLSYRINNSTIFSDPHPADYDWHFTKKTVNSLIGRTLSLTLQNDKIALFGTKTLFPLLHFKRQTTLFNRNLALLNDLREKGYNDGLVEHDLFNPIPKNFNNYSLVISDPPWYLEFYKAFILRSYELLKPNGFLLISILPYLTRPSALLDRKIIVEFALSLGYDLYSISPSFLSYETPKFEINSLRVNGIDCSNWRKSDLFIFKKSYQHILNNTILDYPPNEPEWHDYRFKNKKIKIKKIEDSGDTFDFENADPQNCIFTDVSRRSPYRDRIDIWASDNKAFKVYRLSLFREFLEIVCEKNNLFLALRQIKDSKRNISDEEIKRIRDLFEKIMAKIEI